MALIQANQFPSPERAWHKHQEFLQLLEEQQTPAPLADPWCKRREPEPPAPSEKPAVDAEPPAQSTSEEPPITLTAAQRRQYSWDNLKEHLHDRY